MTNFIFFYSIDLKSEYSTYFLKFRKYDDLYDNLRIADLKDISNLTGCLKPCQYKKYTFVGEKEPTMLKSGENVAFSLWAVSKSRRVCKEQLIFPISRLIAEFGGALGLFLGVSFITLWDNIYLTVPFYKLVFKK